jgi:hypothetical protein
VSGRKIVLWLVVAFVIFYIMNSPSDAAQLIKNIQHLLGHIFTGLQRFLDSFHG